MKLTIMTKTTFFVEEDKILSSLFDEGMTDLHLYKPGASPMYSERLLSLLPEETHRYIRVHENFYLKDEYGLAGIHLDNASDVLPAGYRGHYSRTALSLSELKEMKRKSQYVFLRNIFDCIDNPAERSTFTMAQLEQAAREGLIDKKVYALGGMTLDNIRLAKDLGFGGVVICGDLWDHFDIYNQSDFLALIKHFERLKRAVG